MSIQRPTKEKVQQGKWYVFNPSFSLLDIHSNHILIFLSSDLDRNGQIKSSAADRHETKTPH